MDQYFEWFDMSEERKFRFAKLKFTRQARLYWGKLERLIGRRGENPIATWQGMKRRLRDKYLPVSYNQRLIDQWQKLTQGNKSIAEYIAKFDEYVMRCDVEESESVTLSRFRAGLREELQKELFMREVFDLEQAYQVARDAERFHRGPMYRRPEPPRISTPSQPSGPSQTRPHRSIPDTPLTRRDDRGKAPEVQRTPNPNVACFKCHKSGHYASNCPSRALHIGDLANPESDPAEPLEDCEEEVYHAEDNLVDEYEGDEDYVEPDLVGVVRCILTQTKTQEDWRRTNILHTFVNWEIRYAR